MPTTPIALPRPIIRSKKHHPTSIQTKPPPTPKSVSRASSLLLSLLSGPPTKKTSDPVQVSAESPHMSADPPQVSADPTQVSVVPPPQVSVVLPPQGVSAESPQVSVDPPQTQSAEVCDHVPSIIEIDDIPSTQPPTSEWLLNLKLTIAERDILQSSAWLNDLIINAAQQVLKSNIDNRILGWQHTQCCSKLSMFRTVPHIAPFIQVLHLYNHWVTVSNINVHAKDKPLTATVGVYDSRKEFKVSDSLVDMVCSFYKPPTSPLHFDIVNMQIQENDDDCGLFAIASATELAYGRDPSTCNWDCSKMSRAVFRITCCHFPE